MRVVIGLVTRQRGLSINHLLSGTFIPKGEAKTQRLPNLIVALTNI